MAVNEDIAALFEPLKHPGDEIIVSIVNHRRRVVLIRTVTEFGTELGSYVDLGFPIDPVALFAELEQIQVSEIERRRAA